MDKHPYLSICIPTYQRIEITRNTIKSIYADLEGVDLCDFEVIVSDNDPKESSRVFETEFLYDNFHYYPTQCEGFLNSYYVLGYGKGEFLKLQNNSSMFKKGSLAYIINQVKSLIEAKPVIFHTNGSLKRFDARKYDSADDFYYNLSYFSSWSAGFGIWKEDYSKFKNVNNINKMFPQTTLLMSCSQKSSFVIDDTLTREGQPVKKKGGYNPYEVFGCSFLDIFNQALVENIISEKTFNIIKRDILKKYLATRYLKTAILRKDSFDTSNISKHLMKYYGSYAYAKLLFYALISPLQKL